MQRKKDILIIITAFLLSNNFADIAAAKNDFSIIKRITSEKIIYERYVYEKEVEINISDLELWEEAQGKDDIFNTTYNASIDFRVFLLERGYAALKNPQQANKIEQEAQKNAQEKHLGKWRQKNSSPQSSEKKKFASVIDFSRGIDLKLTVGYLWKIAAFLLSIGLINELCKFFYKNIIYKENSNCS